LRAHNVDLEAFPPVVISMLLAQMARSMCNEIAIGVTDGHQEMRAFLDRFVNEYGATTSSEKVR
jgi:hypothetical protein